MAIFWPHHAHKLASEWLLGKKRCPAAGNPVAGHLVGNPLAEQLWCVALRHAAASQSQSQQICVVGLLVSQPCVAGDGGDG